jgi:hypothetical protein
MKKAISRRRFLTQAGLTVGAVGLAGSCSDDGSNSTAQTKELPKRQLGRTGQLVSRIGFGGGSRYYQWIPHERDAEKMIHYAIQLGVNYFDTARAYGSSQESEIRYGKYLTPNYRDRIFLVSKTQDRTYDGVMHDIEASLQNLKTGYLDLYHMHAMTGMDDLTKLSAVDGGFKAYRKLKDEGVIKNIGFSFHVDWNDGIRQCVERLDPDVIMCALNALKEGTNSGNGNEENLLPLAKERNIGIVAMKVTGQNALIGNVSGKDLLHYSLSLPGVVLANVGMDGFATLESCVEVAKAPALSIEQRTTIQTRLAGDSGKDKLAYLEADYFDGERPV